MSWRCLCRRRAAGRMCQGLCAARTEASLGTAPLPCPPLLCRKNRGCCRTPAEEEEDLSSARTHASTGFFGHAQRPPCLSLSSCAGRTGNAVPEMQDCNGRHFGSPMQLGLSVQLAQRAAWAPSRLALAAVQAEQRVPPHPCTFTCRVSCYTKLLTEAQKRLLESASCLCSCMAEAGCFCIAMQNQTERATTMSLLQNSSKRHRPGNAV